MAKKGSIFEGDLEKEGIKKKKEHSHDEILDEPDEHEESPGKLTQEMQTGEKESDVYSEEGRKELVSGGEIEEWEQGFSEGAEGRGGQANCAHCGKLLGQRDKVVERKINNELHFFCSESCAEKHGKKHLLG